LANSLAVNPHKANTLPAGYLFHGDGDSHADITSQRAEVWDLVDLTVQCGRRGDSLKLALGWIYYGTSGYAAMIDKAFSTAAYFTDEIISRPNFVLVSENPPPCLQVCFYYAQKQS
jgi:glutamate decarboxylase